MRAASRRTAAAVRPRSAIIATRRGKSQIASIVRKTNDATDEALGRSYSDFAKMRMHSQGRTVHVREPPDAALLPLRTVAKKR